MPYKIASCPALDHVFTPRPLGKRRIDMLVLHSTAGSKKGDLRTLTGRDRRHLVSCHYYVTKDGEIYQLVQDKDIAWHAGVSAWQGEPDCNKCSIGVEMENLNDGKDEYPEVQQDAVLWLVRHKIQQYSIPRSRLVRHAQVALPLGRKNDPRGFPWDVFVEQVYAPMAPTLPARYVVRLNDTIVREGPGTFHKEALNGTRELYAGAVVEVDELKPGEQITRTVEGKRITSNIWLHMANGEGFVWSGLLMPAQGV